MLGNVSYMSPNMAEESYGPETDLWSLGAVLYSLFSGKPLFPETKKTMQNLLLFESVNFSSPEWKSVSLGAKDLISKLLQKEESKRLRAKDVLCM